MLLILNGAKEKQKQVQRSMINNNNVGAITNNIIQKENNIHRFSCCRVTEK